MYDLTNATFCIPIRFDSDERKENLDIVIAYLNRNFKTTIFVVEDGPSPVFGYIQEHPQVKYFYTRNTERYFHRTALLNSSMRITQTKYFINYDADVIVDPGAIDDCVNKIDSGEYQFAYPFNGNFIEVIREYVTKFREEPHVGVLDKTIDSHTTLNHESFGGIVVVDKDKYLSIGGENENFKSWGYEDVERLARMQKFGWKYYRTTNNLYHMSHPRFTNSSNDNEWISANIEEYELIQRLSKEEIIERFGLQ
jgi:hypothetical protein